MNLHNWQTQLRKGLLELVVLNLLSHGQCHGYEMVQNLKKIKGLTIREGNIYPILARLQTDGVIKCTTKASENGPPRKYYELTRAGENILEKMDTHWDQIIDSIQHIRKGDYR